MSTRYGIEPSFADRHEAGQRLAKELRQLQLDNPLILALPRGGVPVAREVATTLGAELDLLLVRKIGAPGHEEFGIGAVAEGQSKPQMVASPEVLAQVDAPAGYIEAEQARQLAEIARRRLDWRSGRPPVPVKGRTCVVVDDGVATGNTARAAVRSLKLDGAARIVLAVPVAPADVVESLAQEVDQFVCLRTPEPFIAVGLHYRQFGQLGDEDVLRLLGVSVTAGSSGTTSRCGSGRR